VTSILEGYSTHVLLHAYFHCLLLEIRNFSLIFVICITRGRTMFKFGGEHYHTPSLMKPLSQCMTHFFLFVSI